MPEVISPRSYGTVFDEIASEYDRNRPAYPEELVDHACRIAGLAAGDRVLEVGCGSGQLTRSLLARDLRVTALEPGRQLIALAERNLSDRGEVEFVNARFENARLPSEGFQAVFSAAAFHWVDPDVGWRQAARVLVPEGTLALLQHLGLREPPGRGDQQAQFSALERAAPELAARWPVYRDLAEILAGVEQRRDNVSEAWAWIGTHDVARAHAGVLFGDVQVACVPIALEHTPAELIRMLGTTSFYSRLSPDVRQALEREYVALYQRLGRPIRSTTGAVLVTAPRT